jgi:hypothetical protein
MGPVGLMGQNAIPITASIAAPESRILITQLLLWFVGISRASQMGPTAKTAVGIAAMMHLRTEVRPAVVNVSQLVLNVILATQITHVTYVAITHTGRKTTLTNADVWKMEQNVTLERIVINAVTEHMMTTATLAEEPALPMGRNVNMGRNVIYVVHGPTIGIRQESILVVPKNAMTMANLVFLTNHVASVAVGVLMTATVRYAVANV